MALIDIFFLQLLLGMLFLMISLAHCLWALHTASLLPRVDRQAMVAITGMLLLQRADRQAMVAIIG
eukprot:6092647-Prorocentrum_lima.AAC.1